MPVRLPRCDGRIRNILRSDAPDPPIVIDPPLRDAGIGANVAADEVLFKARPRIKALFAYIERETVDIVLCQAPADIVADRYRTSRLISELRGRDIALWSTTLGEPVTLRNVSHVEGEDDGARDGNRTTQTERPRSKIGGIRPAGFGYKLSCAVDGGGQRISSSMAWLPMMR